MLNYSNCALSNHTVHLHTAGDTGKVPIAPLLLIPFIENAFKHKDCRNLRPAGGHSHEAPAHIFIKTEYRLQKIDLADMLYIEGLRDYIAIHTLASKILSLESMRNMEETLPANFIRIHKSYIINKSKIDFVERGKVVINKQYLPVGETYRERFLLELGL